MSATSAPLTDSRIMLRRNLKHILGIRSRYSTGP